MAIEALFTGLMLGGMGGWWLSHRQRATVPLAAQPPEATPPAASESDLIYDRMFALAGYQASFLASTSHELRSPLNQIISLHQLIQEDLCEDPEEERMFLAQAQEATLQVLKNLDLLTTISKLEVGRIEPDLQPLQLAQLFSKVEVLVSLQAANRNCRLKVIAPPGDLYVYSDPQWLQQVLVLLIEGAIATDSRQIVLSCQPSQAKTEHILIEHDSQLDAWQNASAEESPVDFSSAEAANLCILSPPFRLRLATRIMGKLQSQLAVLNTLRTHLTATSEDDAYACLALSIPIAYDEHSAD